MITIQLLLFLSVLLAVASLVQLIALRKIVRGAQMDERLRRRLEALCDEYMIEDSGTVPVLQRIGEERLDG